MDNRRTQTDMGGNVLDRFWKYSIYLPVITGAGRIENIASYGNAASGGIREYDDRHDEQLIH